MLTFFTIKSYFALAIVTLALHGLGFSFVYATAISAAQVRPVVCTVHLYCTPALYTCNVHLYSHFHPELVPKVQARPGGQHRAVGVRLRLAHLGSYPGET